MRLLRMWLYDLVYNVFIMRMVLILFGMRMSQSLQLDILIKILSTYQLVSQLTNAWLVHEIWNLSLKILQ